MCARLGAPLKPVMTSSRSFRRRVFICCVIKKKVDRGGQRFGICSRGAMASAKAFSSRERSCLMLCTMFVWPPLPRAQNTCFWESTVADKKKRCRIALYRNKKKFTIVKGSSTSSYSLTPKPCLFFFLPPTFRAESLCT